MRELPNKNVCVSPAPKAGFTFVGSSVKILGSDSFPPMTDGRTHN